MRAPGDRGPSTAPGDAAEERAPGGLAEALRKATIVVSIAASLAYIVWRAAFTYHPEYLVYSALFVAADAIGVASFVTFAFSLWDLRPRPPAPPPRPGISVDVWIPTLSEEEEVLRRTVTHCVAMDYPHETYVLDDGRRPWVESLCRELGARYVTRPDNRDAKAGNLNHALSATSGELIATFDADFVPSKHFLTRLIGHFDDPKVALVQTPQTYYNLDSFQHRFEPTRRRLWGTQDLFFDALMVGKDRWNAAFWIGTAAVLRRSALRQIGGFPTESIVEDMLTTIELHAAGWRSVYVNEPLAFGIAPAYVSQYLSQRLRWTRGVMQIVRAANPLTRPGLTLAQRLCYANSVLHFFDALPRAAYYLVPGIYLLTGATPMFLKPDVLRLVLAYIALHLVAVKVISRGKVRIFRNELYALVHFLSYLRGNLALLSGRPHAFGVTAKLGRQAVRAGYLLGPALVFLFSAASLAAAWVKSGDPRASLDAFALSVTAPFSTFYALLALAAIRLGVTRPYHPGAYLVCDPVPVELEGTSGLGVTRALGESELLLLSPARLPVEGTVGVTLRLPGEPCRASLRVTRCARLLDEPGAELFEVHGRFLDSGNGTRARIVRHLFEHALPRFLRRFTDHDSRPARWRDLLARDGAAVDLEAPARVDGLGAEPVIATAAAASRRGVVLAAPEPAPVGAAVTLSFAGVKGLPGRVTGVHDERASVPGLVWIGVAFDYPIEPPRRWGEVSSRIIDGLFRRRVLGAGW